MLENYQNTHFPRFSFTPKTGMLFLETGVLFLLWCIAKPCVIFFDMLDTLHISIKNFHISRQILQSGARPQRLQWSMTFAESRRDRFDNYSLQKTVEEVRPPQLARRWVLPHRRRSAQYMRRKLRRSQRPRNNGCFNSLGLPPTAYIIAVSIQSLWDRFSGL